MFRGILGKKKTEKESGTKPSNSNNVHSLPTTTSTSSTKKNNISSAEGEVFARLRSMIGDDVIANKKLDEYIIFCKKQAERMDMLAQFDDRLITYADKVRQFNTRIQALLEVYEYDAEMLKKDVGKGKMDVTLKLLNELAEKNPTTFQVHRDQWSLLFSRSLIAAGYNELAKEYAELIEAYKNLNIGVLNDTGEMLVQMIFDITGMTNNDVAPSPISSMQELAKQYALMRELLDAQRRAFEAEAAEIYIQTRKQFFDCPGAAGKHGKYIERKDTQEIFNPFPDGIAEMEVWIQRFNPYRDDPSIKELLKRWEDALNDDCLSGLETLHNKLSSDKLDELASAIEPIIKDIRQTKEVTKDESERRKKTQENIKARGLHGFNRPAASQTPELPHASRSSSPPRNNNDHSSKRI